MQAEETLILNTLDKLNISYEIISHPPAFTVSELKTFCECDASVCKNLFLYDKRADKHYLVVMLEEKKAHSNTIRKQVKAASLVFGEENKLFELLGVTPGSISPLGLIYDANQEITILIDQDLPNHPKLGFHPNINTATVIISYTDFKKFIDWRGNPYQLICVTKEE
ncbi:prolyl-tRNA synthetase associated domain-containing protein [Cellulosilyticum sp. I15G10I2]|uniref:prolyl-tRNA synthetase associated domain-containing protein n=1 Tax=Cellulosilyticum sp. I15G10I2 TaxID=1892843 RepID=UPI00085BEC10|nr:prolyl-tRNA synthetase associated domain-containing protein [Cellulosilyticum sp. I15G10I2]